MGFLATWIETQQFSLFRSTHEQVFSVASRKSAKYNLFSKKYERKTDSKLNSYIDLLWFLTTTEKNKTKQVKSLFLATVRVLCPPEFFLPATAY